MSKLPIRLGSEGKLRVQFLDSNNDPIQATSVSVDLFAPNLDPDLDSPTQAGLVPSYLGNGVFELTFTPSGTAGFWIASWTGTIIDTVTNFQESFEVINSGSVVSYPVKGLQKNMLISVLLSKSISDVNGNSLNKDFLFSFTTEYSHLYSSVKKVKLEAGGILGQIPDDVINLAIFEASLEADIINFRKQTVNNELFLHARREYVTCVASLMLAQNILANGGVIKSKALADFKVDYDINILSNLLNSLYDCKKKWEEQVQSGGGARAIKNPKMVIKGELDPDRPPVGRGWLEQKVHEIPVGNAKLSKRNSRRWHTGWLYKNNNKPGGNW